MKYHISIDTDFQKNIYPGTFIALEGIDGSGKSSQIESIQKYFEDQGRKVVITRSPRKNEGVLATLNKDILQGNLTIPKPAFQYLFTADYIIQTEELIIPALKRGDVVITDRFHCWSSLAYGIWESSQEYDMSIAQSLLIAQGLFSPAYQLIVPDITYFFQVSVDTALIRIAKKAEAAELYDKKEILEKVKKGYEWLLKEFPECFCVIDAERSLDEVTKSMLEKLRKP